MTYCKHLLQQRITTMSKTLSSPRAMVTDGVLNLGCASVIFVAKDDGTYYCDLLLPQQLLPAIRHVSSEFTL